MALGGPMASSGLAPVLSVVPSLRQRPTLHFRHVRRKHRGMMKPPTLPVMDQPRAPNKAHVCCAVSADTAESEVAVSNDPDTVRAVLFDMDGVLCNSEEISRKYAPTLHCCNIHHLHFCHWHNTYNSFDKEYLS
jgi:hypothetical protein